MNSLRMRHVFLGWGTIVALLSSLLAVGVQGQTEDTQVNFSPMPNVSVQDVAVTANDTSSATGTFKVTNNDPHYIGNLTFDYLILGPSPELKAGELVLDNAPIYTQIPSGSELALSPNEEKDFPFSLTKIPTLPKGSYRLRIQLKTQDDRRLGWSDAEVTLGNDLAAFGVIKGGAVEVESVDPATNEKRSVWLPFEGVNVDPGQSINLKANVQAIGANDLNGVVILNVRKGLLQTSEPEKVTGPTVAIPASTTQEISIPITAPSAPGVYEISGFVSDSQGSIVSSTAIYRLVVKGQSASIIRATIDKPATRANETATVAFSVVGSADRLGDATGTLEVAILSDGIIVGETTSTVQLTSAPTDGIASVQLKQNVSGTLGLRVTIKDKDGNVLATSTSNFKGVDFGGGWNKKAVLLVGISVVTFIALVGVAMLWWHRHKNGPMGPTSTYTTAAMLLLLLGIGFLVSSASVDALSDTLNLGNGIEFRNVTHCTGRRCDQSAVAKSVTYTNITPINNIPYGSQVRFDVRHEWFACDNAYTNVALNIRALQNGGTHVTSMGQAASLPWVSMGSWNRTLAPNSYNNLLFFYDFGFTLTYSGSTTIPPSAYPNNLSTFWTHGTTYLQQNSGGATVDTDEFRWLTFAPVNNSVCSGLTVPATVAAGVSFPAKVTMLNNGSTPWTTDATPHRLGFQNPQDTTRWGLQRVELPAGPAVPYGQAAAFNFNAMAPTTAGTYPFVVQMVEDGVQWFGTQCSQNIVVTGAPTPPPTLTCAGDDDDFDDDGRHNRDDDDDDNDGRKDNDDDDDDNDGRRDSDDDDDDNDGRRDSDDDALDCPIPTPTPTTSLTGADLGLTITAPASVARGSLISYSLQATNTGPQAASQAVVTVQIPATFTFHAASSSSACTQQGGTVRCTAATLSSGQSTLFAVVFTVGQNATCNSKVKNTASVTSATPDPSTTNNSATSGETTVTCGQCQDGVDNDNDGRTDAADPACHDDYDLNKPYNPTRTSETDTQCTDKKDNDGDGVIDEKDPGCHVGTDLAKPYVPSHNNEAGIPPLDPGGFRETE